MSQITRRFRIGLILAVMLAAVAGCGTPNDQAPFDVDEQGHTADWRWTKHAEAARVETLSCRECHGEGLEGGIAQVACDSCHVNGVTALTGCTSCHGNPPSGTAAPNRKGAHAVHYAAIQSTTNGCDGCHSGAGSGTTNHNDGQTEVSFLGAFNAKSGAATRNGDGTCSSVSCHGGQTTPAWLSGTTIDVNTQCESCHAFGTGEYNSYASGKHDVHVITARFECTRCHDTDKLALTHFTHLETPSMEGPAAATIKSNFNYTTYPNGSQCGPVCHSTRWW